MPDTARHPDDPRLQHLLNRMSHHAEFEHWWQAHEVAVQGTGNKVFPPSTGWHSRPRLGHAHQLHSP
ncbi:MmyB family transcriptional regulator [Streptomyces sp. NBC_00306]|uniref:MmyB family transcriptional regulator n=1 Tax=Streptomyces sp. NBC_00306 TaxID=2975708 RepID=UPI002E28540E|nr:hypothetical protein [Streptomyces sp. NBC_00306]